jgi:predicted metal-dependent phosphoesterase TrpH
MLHSYFANPFDVKGFWFKGNLHTHTTNSDGGFTPKETAIIYKSQGYDFLAITDHNIVIGLKQLSDISLDKFLIIPGIEIDGGKSEVDTRYHIVGLNLNYQVESDNPQIIIDEILNNGGEAIIAHPYWSSLTINDLIKLDSYLGLETFNTTCHFSNAKGYSSIHWDNLLDRDKNILGFAADDTHSSSDLGFAWIQVKAKDLTIESLMASIKNGLFYSSNGPKIFNISIKNGLIKVKSSPSRSINFITQNGFGKRFTNQKNPLVEAKYKIGGFENYIRIEIEDNKGQKAWTNPLIFN